MINTVSLLPNRSRVVDEYVKHLPGKTRFLVENLRNIILSSSDRIREQIKHEIPFYLYKGQLCYINHSERKVIIGFSRGAELHDEHKLLEGHGKTLRRIIIDPDKTIDEEKIRNLVYEALIVNEMKTQS
jgi:hypothetical protein